MRWLIAVTKSEGEERLLGDVLEALGMHLVTEADMQCLVGPSLDRCTSPAEVFAAASKISRSINEATRYEPALGLQLTLGSRIIEVTATEKRQHHYLVPITGVLAVGTAGAVSVALGVAGSVDEAEARRLVAERAERAYQDRLGKAVTRVRSAERSADAVKVQRLLAGELTPQAMGVISDLLEENAKGARDSLIGSKNDWTRFDRSINHPQVFGDKARHGKTRHAPPAKPMFMDEVQSFIRAAALNWLRRVAL
jgi:hypothetical protein